MWRQIEERLSLVQHPSPAWLGRLGTQPEVRESRFRENRDGEENCRLNNDDTENVRKDVFKRDPNPSLGFQP